MKCSRLGCPTPRKDVKVWTPSVTLCAPHREIAQIQIATREHMESMERNKR